MNKKSKALALCGGGASTFCLTIVEPARWGMNGGTLRIRDTAHDGHIVIGPEISKSGKPRLVPVPALHWHDLRHTAASWWAQSGATLILLLDLLGHTSFAETTRYSHLVRGDLKAGAERMAELITAGAVVAQKPHTET